MPISNTKVALITLLTGLTGLAHASDDMSTKVSTGLFYSSGQSEIIDTDDATTTSVPLMLSMKKGDFSFSLSTAYISVDSDTFDTSGMGDTTVSLGYDLTESPWLTLKLKNKFATGDETKGLSTGENDTSVQLDYFYPIKSNTSLFANVGHKFVGKVSGVEMQDSSYGSIGAGYIFPSKTNIGVSLDYRQSVYSDLDDQTGASVFVSRPITKTYSLSGFGSYDNTQTLSTGLTITAKF
ncbi:MAG: hypothetical protein U9N57_05340 [Pseudomonadota bacterium]|nr:hypothetical protein [Pseudomonadota bacterium]